jgi:hypothetical protein
MINETKYKQLVFALIFCFLIFLNLKIVVGQDVYRTQSGDMVVTLIAEDSVFTLSSKEIDIQLNNSTAKFIMSIDKATFKSANVKVNEKLAAVKSDKILFSGKLGIESIQRYDHIPLDFEVEGMLSTNNKIVLGSGRLEHISSEGDISCLLTLKFNISKEDLGLDIQGIELNDEVQIDVVQVLLIN